MNRSLCLFATKSLSRVLFPFRAPFPCVFLLPDWLVGWPSNQCLWHDCALCMIPSIVCECSRYSTVAMEVVRTTAYRVRRWIYTKNTDSSMNGRASSSKNALAFQHIIIVYRRTESSFLRSSYTCIPHSQYSFFVLLLLVLWVFFSILLARVVLAYAECVQICNIGFIPVEDG